MQNSTLSFLLFFVFSISCQETIDVLKISNVEFPVSDKEAAYFNATFYKDISEVTVCFRFLVESYNTGLIYLLWGMNKDKKGYFLDRIGYEDGMERDGYQGGVSVVIRNIPGGGLGGLNFPVYHQYNVPKNIGTSKEGNQNIFMGYL